jgi:hypothetical protein
MAAIRENDVFILCQHTFDLTSLSCICLATFHRYLISSREARLRNLSTTKKQTKLIILFLIYLFGFDSIPIIKYYGLSKRGYCRIVSTVYAYYI